MIRCILAAVVLLVLPASLGAQVQPLRVAAGGTTKAIPPALHRGYPAYPAEALTNVGAQVTTGPEGARVVLASDTLVFETFSPFFRIGAQVRQMVAPAYREGGIVYLPQQLFVDWLPRRYPHRFRYRDGVLQVAITTTTETASPAAAASGQARAPAEKATQPGAGAKTGSPYVGPRVVVIDAGHGGRDPGKPGPNGLQEKEVTLAVAKRLARELEKRGGYEVHLTRTTDTLIALADRPRMANEWKAGRPAALFISLHANSASNRSARGFETFFLSEARTEDERRVAEMENAAVEYEEAAVHDGDGIGWILNTLRNDFYQRASNDLAEVIQREIDRIHPGPNRGVKQAGFRVLVGAFMPAVLVEMAFISNRQEAALLGDARFQQRMTTALADAIEEFFRSHEHLWVAEGP